MKKHAVIVLLLLTAFWPNCRKGKADCVSKVNLADDFNGLNWADTRDNFVNGYIVPSGLDLLASYTTIFEQATRFIQQFRAHTGINTIRIGINAPTVLDGDYFPKWKAIVDATLKEHVRVILACWERPDEKDGRVDSRFLPCGIK